MSVEIKRCCNSSVKDTDNKITFTAFNISIEGPYKVDFDWIVDGYVKSGYCDPQTPDLKAKILAKILADGIEYVGELVDKVKEVKE